MYEKEIIDQRTEGRQLTEAEVQCLDLFLKKWLKDGHDIARLHADAEAVAAGIDVTTPEYNKAQEIFWGIVSVPLLSAKIRSLYLDGAIGTIVSSINAAHEAGESSVTTP